MVKHCTTCARELPDDAELCAGCGATQPDEVAHDPSSAALAPSFEAPTQSKRTAAWKVAVPIVVLLVLAGAGAAFAWLDANPTIPDLAGFDLEQSGIALENAGFAAGAYEYDPASTEPTWTVISQSVAAGERAERGTPVGLTLAGAPPTDVPALVSLARAEAESMIVSATLSVSDVTESYDATAAAGTIISQHPEAGTVVPEGSPVTFVVSKGPKPVAVPDVADKSQADAEAALTAAGFIVRSSTKDDTAPKGTILSQIPAANSEAIPGTEIAIVVSTGVEMVKVPSWKDFPNGSEQMTQEEWDDEYEKYGYGPTMDRMEAALIKGFSKVGLNAAVTFDPDWSKTSYQTPKAGTMVPKGTTVKIMIYVAD
ncbi:MAG: PASTA domain-containing protein [Coriobacteriia bacterium]|nr:PASTA domain-containing protein [Coriobacteriia bacterium]